MYVHVNPTVRKNWDQITLFRVNSHALAMIVKGYMFLVLFFFVVNWARFKTCIKTERWYRKFLATSWPAP